MAESFVERRKRELGLTGEKQGRMSFVERRKIELGLSPPTPEYQREVEAERKKAAQESYRKAKSLHDKIFGASKTEEKPMGIPLAKTGPKPGDLAYFPILESDVAKSIQQEVQKERESKKTDDPLLRAVDRFFSGRYKKIGEKIEETPVGKAIEGLYRADRAISDVKAGALDTATLGATQGIGRAAINMIPGGEENLKPILEERTKSTPYKVGEFAGYLVPGAAAERAAATTLRPVIQNLPRAAQLGIRGAVAGAADVAAQEAGDVAFRGGTFDPENIAVGGAIGGAVGAASPLIESAVRRLGGRRSTTSVMDDANIRSSTSEATEGEIKRLQDSVTPEPSQPARPQRQNWFTALFGDWGVGISPFGSKKRIRDVPLTTADQIVSSPLKREGSAVETAMRAAYQNFVDYLRPLKEIDEQAYIKAIDASRANNIANTIITDKLVTPEGNVIGEGLENIFRKVARGRSRDFVDYLVLRHAATRMARGEQVYDPALNMTVEKVQELIRRHEQLNPGFAEIAREFDQFMDRLLYHYGVEEGLISPQLYQTLRERNPNYVPMRRQFSFGEKLKAGKFAASPSGFSGQKAPIKKVSPTGSARKIVDPRRSVIEQVGAWVNAAMRNRVMQQLVDVVKRNPDEWKDIIEIVQKPQGQPNLGKILRDEGVEGFLEELDNDFVQLFKRTRLDKDNIVRAMVKGQPVYLQVKNPEVLKALIGMAPDQANFVMRVFETLSNATKRGATGVLAPMFAIRTVTADLAQALIQSKNPAVHLWDFGHALISSIADTILPKNAQVGQRLRALAQEYRRVGGIYSAALRSDQQLRKGVSRMNRYPIFSPKYVMHLVGRTVSLPFRALEGLANVSENVNRMAAFRSEMRRLGGEKTPENVMRAMQAAREITVNWSRRGLQSRNIEKVVPYNNAAIQGLYRFAAAWKRNPIKTTAMVAAGVMAPKFYEYMMFHDDPDYQALPAREKYMNLIVAKNPDGTFVKIKMPYEYAAFGAFMVDSLEALLDQNPEAFKGAADALANTFTPPVVSGALQGFTQGGGGEQSLSGMAQATVLGPAVSILSNRNYAGVPIESMALQDRSPQYRYDERTSAVAKELGRALASIGLDLSPKKIDYIIRAYGGDPARLLLPLTSDVGGGEIRNTLLRNFIADPVFSNNLQNDFYTAKERLTQAKRDNTEVGAPLPKWYSEELYKLVSSQAKGSISSRLKALRDQKTQIMLDRSIPVEERSKRLREVQRQINEILIDVNARLYEAGVPMR